MGFQNRLDAWALLRATALGLLVTAAAQSQASVTNPTIGRLLWSEEFNGTALNTSLWTSYDGNGCQINLCGYGNAELEYYSPSNLSIADVPFEPGTRALAIRALRQTVGSNQFTSGKIDSYGKVQVQYGMIEIRMATPQVTTGLWPAAWMLGTSPQAWPRKGEIDIVEQGHRASAWAAAGAPSADYFVGSNVITWSQAACVPGNESCAASTAWQTKNWYKPQVSLANRFVKYRFYWTDTQMRFTVVDTDGEHDLYDAPLPVNSAALQAPFYLLLNLAVGGNFTDAATPSQVSAPLPATMYVDYIRVYELDGKGEVKLGSQVVPEVGKFGVFTDNTVVNNKLVAGTSSDIYLWNTASTGAGNIQPYEGNNVIAWSYNTPGQWFGGGIQSRQIRDLTNFRNGNVKFRIKIPADVSFNIGIGDTYTNQSWVNFPANATSFGLVRNGDWATATIPVSTLIGPKVALQSIADIFMISSDNNRMPTSAFQFAIDDVVWDFGTTPTDPQTPTTPAGISQPTSSSVKFSEPTGTWTDVHYTINGGGQLNVRMLKEGSGNAYTVTGLKKGDVVRYSFTYWDPVRNGAYDTAPESYTLK
ncbi:MAG: family 16 glycosylhydrolase [Mitsuaria chitosanitabida]|uniref:glycoside hydrolase family 16 protein n=1 Tax=Roseateles chitosanitabidus TaxID=65048 RepID=UPI001B05D0B8|nr:family 16 glycosylhydrolase [Roseateles chitosanitabidus]MBO9689150.1 family 16 glycosylhydrolase [Roseateles chitosanitabidus]